MLSIARAQVALAAKAARIQAIGYRHRSGCSRRPSWLSPAHRWKRSNHSRSAWDGPFPGCRHSPPASITTFTWHSADSCESRSSTITDTRADGTQRTSHLRLEQYERNFPVGLGLVVGVVLMIGDNLRPQTASLLRGRNAGPHTVRRFPLQCHLDVGIVP